MSGIIIIYMYAIAIIVKHPVVFLRFSIFYLIKVVKFFKLINRSSNFMSLASGAQDHKHAVNRGLVDHANSTHCVKCSLCSSDFERYANQLMEDYSIARPTSVDDALKLYFLILADIENMYSTRQKNFPFRYCFTKK